MEISMTRVTIFGAGKMGSAIGAIFRDGGHEVTHVTPSSANAAIDGEIVVLAVPFGAVEAIAAAYGEQLAGRVVVDVTNPVDWVTFRPAVPGESSGAAEVAALLPGARVVKGFNTTFVQALSDPAKTATVLLAGDDVDAKAAVAAAVEAGGFRTIDAGGQAVARELEAFALLQIQLAMAGKIAGLAVVPA
jgi:predicted dinucleotide-binding enzyme